MSSWEMTPLGDVADVVPGFAFKSKDWCDEGVPVLKIKNITGDGSVETSVADCVPSEINSDRMRRYRLGFGDILIAMTGATAGKVGIIRSHGLFLLNQRVAKLVPRGVDAGYFWSVVRSEEYEKLFFRLADGAAQPNMSGSQIERLPIPVPPLATQQRIAAILGAYDDLIEVNRRRVAVLEEMARGLFEEWFVRFRFPGHEDVPIVDTPNGPLPKGWEHSVASEAFQALRGRSYRSADLAEEGGLPFVNLKCIERGGGFRESGLKRYTGDFKPHQVVQRGDIVMAVTDMTQQRLIVGRVGRVPLLEEPEAVISMDLIKVAPREPVGGEFLYAYLRFSNFGPIAAQHANGANVLHLSPKALVDIPFLIPSGTIQSQYAAQVGPIIELSETLEAAERHLAASRDLLLPRLISGQLSVVAAERELEDAA